MKLSKTQQELLQKMQAGEKLHYMAYMGSYNPSAYFFCGDGHGRCTAAANALIEKGLVHGVGTWKKDYSLTEAGKAWQHNVKLCGERSESERTPC